MDFLPDKPIHSFQNKFKNLEKKINKNITNNTDKAADKFKIDGLKDAVHRAVKTGAIGAINAGNCLKGAAVSVGAAASGVAAYSTA